MASAKANFAISLRPSTKDGTTPNAWMRPWYTSADGKRDCDPAETPKLRPERPNKAEFVDNRELTMAQALCAHLDWLYNTYARPISVDIATGYFNPEGFALLADRLDLSWRGFV